MILVAAAPAVLALGRAVIAQGGGSSSVGFDHLDGSALESRTIGLDVVFV